MKKVKLCSTERGGCGFCKFVIWTWMWTWSSGCGKEVCWVACRYDLLLITVSIQWFFTVHCQKLVSCWLLSNDFVCSWRKFFKKVLFCLKRSKTCRENCTCFVRNKVESANFITIGCLDSKYWLHIFDNGSLKFGRQFFTLVCLKLRLD